VGALKHLTTVLALAFAFAAPAAAQSVDRWNAQIEEASARFGIPADWIRRVIQAESDGRTMLDGRPIISRAGAMGLMQLMPATWNEMRALLGLGRDPHDARDNILAGTAYLRAMYDRFGYPGLFAAYNAGPTRFARHLATGARLPRETVAYVADLSGTPARTALPKQVRTHSMFVGLAGSQSPAIEAARPPPNALFVPLSTPLLASQ
jgi:soluble lytic murein transglycosylase-like protein